MRKFLLGIILFLPLGIIAQTKVTPETALKSYIYNQDKTFAWEIKDVHAENGVTRYNVLLTSQKWREYTWKHQLTVFVPDNMRYDGALFFITGGSVKNGEPNWSSNDRYWKVMADIAHQNKAVTAMIRQVPNQPIIGTLTEDEMISYTFHQFKQDGDFTWPLLFPMVKSAVRGMDAVQELVKQKKQKEVKRFVVSGASKRGWTTWLTSAIDDPRVAAIGPMVIDMLNMPATLGYQYKTYGEYSIQIEDYTKLGIAQDIESKDGQALQAMIDPYSYRQKLNHPKMIFIGTNDEYWTLDAIKFSWKDIPGKNMIHMVPNAGHDLAGGLQAFEALSGFFAHTLQNKSYPVLEWQTKSTALGTELLIKAPREGLVEARLWYTTSSDKDFRNNYWQDTRVRYGNEEWIKVPIPNPKKGYYGFYVDFKYQHPESGTFLVSTRAYIADANGLQD